MDYFYFSLYEIKMETKKIFFLSNYDFLAGIGIREENNNNVK